MRWATVWMKLFGTTSFWEIDMGFWAAMAGIVLIVFLMNAVFWGLKPKSKSDSAYQHER